MTLYEIKVAIHYATCEVEYEPSPILSETIDKFITRGLLKKEIGGIYEPSRHVATSKLKAYVEFLKDVPIPISKWVLPDKHK